MGDATVAFGQGQLWWVCLTVEDGGGVSSPAKSACRNRDRVLLHSAGKPWDVRCSCSAFLRNRPRRVHATEWNKEWSHHWGVGLVIVCLLRYVSQVMNWSRKTAVRAAEAQVWWQLPYLSNSGQAPSY